MQKGRQKRVAAGDVRGKRLARSDDSKGLKPGFELEYYDTLASGPHVFFARTMECMVQYLISSGCDIGYYTCMPSLDGIDNFARSCSAKRSKEILSRLPLAGIRVMNRNYGVVRERRDDFYEFKVCPHPVYVGSIQSITTDFGQIGSHGATILCAWDEAEAMLFLEKFDAFTRDSRREQVVNYMGHPISKFRRMRWEDIVLPGTRVAEIRSEVENFFESRAVYEENGLDWRMGILLVGPPGNGKTALCRATASTTKVPVVYCSLDEPDMFHILRNAQQTVASHAPCVLIIEDADTLGCEETLRSSFLNMLDGLCGNAGVLTIATTNCPEKLDGAFTGRPSRFDSLYVLENPALSQRTEIMRLKLGKHARRVGEKGLGAIAAMTDGFSAAAVQEVVIGAMRFAFHGNKKLTPEMLKASAERVRTHMVCSSQGVDKWLKGSVGFSPPGEEVVGTELRPFQRIMQ